MAQSKATFLPLISLSCSVLVFFLGLTAFCDLGNGLKLV